MPTDVLGEREEMVFAWAARRALPVAFVLASGYTSDVLPPEDIVDLHRMTIEACAGGNHASRLSAELKFRPTSLGGTEVPPYVCRRN